jgi:hypothetical protein
MASTANDNTGIEGKRYVVAFYDGNEWQPVRKPSRPEIAGIYTLDAALAVAKQCLLIGKWVAIREANITDLMPIGIEIVVIEL